MRYLILIFCVILIFCDKNNPVDSKPEYLLVINEFMTSNTREADSLILDEDGNAADWIELYNVGTNGFLMKGVGLSDEAGDTIRFKSVLDTIIPPGGFYLLWGGNGLVNPHNHIGFKLSRDPVQEESIVLYDSSGEVMDQIDYYSIPEALESNKSYGRTPDGANNWRQQSRPTPQAPNSG